MSLTQRAARAGHDERSEKDMKHIETAALTLIMTLCSADYSLAKTPSTAELQQSRRKKETAIENRCEAAERRKRGYWKKLGGTYPETFRAAAAVSLHKPIGEYEAYALVSAYFFAHISGCGGPELPEDHGDRWIAESAIGYAGVSGPRVIVEKKTGLTYSPEYPNKPKVRDPKEYLKFIGTE